jgi:predicted Zn-dependent protease
MLKYLFLFALAACSYNPTNVEIEIDSSFTQDKRELILESLNDWSDKTNKGFNYSQVKYIENLSSDNEDNIIKFVNSDVEKDSFAIPNYTELGYTYSNYTTFDHPTHHVQATVLLWQGETDDLFSIVARHEIGHALSVNHYCTEAEGQETGTKCEIISTDPEPSIMHPVIYPQFNVVEPLDIFRFCQIWNCPT